MDATQVLFAVAGFWLAIGLGLMLVMGRRGHSRLSWFLIGATLGPLSLPLAARAADGDERLAPRMVDAGRASEIGHIDVIVGCDGSPESRAALRTALDLTGANLNRLTLATVVPYDPAPIAEKEARLRLLRERSEMADVDGVAPSLEVLHGDPARALMTRAAEDGYELIVAGVRGTGHELFGSVARELSSRSKVPVLLAGGS